MAETKKKTTTKEVEKKVVKKEEVKLNPSVWEVPFNADLVAQALFIYSSNERKGSARQKGRGAVSGGGKKPWKQKGTGRARHGSIRSPLWVGGGVTFATTGRNFSKRINKKMARKATCIMLSERLRNKVLEFANVTDAKAKKLREEEKGTLVISNNENVELKLRNVQKVKTVQPEKLNAKHLVSARKVIVDQEVVKILEERLTNAK